MSLNSLARFSVFGSRFSVLEVGKPNTENRKPNTGNRILFFTFSFLLFISPQGEAREDVDIVTSETIVSHISSVYEEDDFSNEMLGIEGLSEKVSFDLREMEISDVLKYLAVKGELNIISTNNVQGRISLFLKNVTIETVLELLAISNGLAYFVEDNIIYIMTADEYKQLYGRDYLDRRLSRTIKLKYVSAESVGSLLSNIRSGVGEIIVDEATGMIILVDLPEYLDKMEKLAFELDLPTIKRQIPTVTRIFELQYADVETIQVTINEILTEEIGSMQTDVRTNRLVIVDLEEKIEQIAHVIEAFDTKTKEVYIEAKIVEVTLNDQYEMGINWDVLFSGNKYKGLNFLSSFPASLGTSGFGKVTVGTLESDKDLQFILEALKTIGSTEVLSNPHIAVINNEEAFIHVGDREAFVTSSSSQGETTTLVSDQVDFIDVGVKLVVTPTINSDGFIKMKVAPEVSSVREVIKTDGGSQVPIVSTTTASTTVLVKDGVTIVIGGLLQKREETEVKKVPLLGDIPIIGRLFRSERDGSASLPEKREIVVFITPHIISGDRVLPEAAEIVKVAKPIRE